MKIATLATGGIGGYLAVRLAQAGHQVATIARGAHLDAIRRDGLKLVSGAGDVTVRPWIATDDTAEVGPVDAVFLGVKGWSLDAAMEACRPMLGPDTVVVPFLNGVEASDRLAETLGAAHAANGMAQISTTISAPGVITQTGSFNSFVFAERDSRPSPRIDALRKALEDAGVPAPATEDVEAAVWQKFVLFSAMSGVTAAARCRVDDIRATQVLQDTFRAAAEETAALGRARGVALSDAVVDRVMSVLAGLPGEMRASTAIDLERGNRLETPWITGAVVRLSEAAGLACPVNRTLLAVLTPHLAGRG